MSAYRLAEFIEEHNATAIVDAHDHNFLIVASIAHSYDYRCPTQYHSYQHKKTIGKIERISATMAAVREWLGY